MYNTYRSSTKDNLRRSHQMPLSSLSQNLINRDKLINIQKREKLKGLLITKFMKKYGIKNPEMILEEEISKFLLGEKPTDNDLKNLDDKLRRIIEDVKQEENVKKGLMGEAENSNNQLNNLAKDLILPNLANNEALSVKSKNSNISGASHYSKYNLSMGAAAKDADKISRSSKNTNYDLDDLDILSNRNYRSIERFDFPNEQDEWNAIVKYNRKLFEEDKKNNKLKDFEIRKRIREDLDNQIRQKLKRNYEEVEKNRDYDEIMLNHCQFLDELEQKRNQEIRERVQREKENRDKQLQDEKQRKKIEILKEKKYDREYVKNIQSELEKERQILLKKRLDERELMFDTIKENELNKKRAMENKEKERLSDIKATEEYSKVLDRQEQERNEYFRRIERNANNYVNKMADTVLSNIEASNKEEEERMRMFLIEKERRQKEEDERKKKVMIETKKNMKQYFDMQVDEKKRTNEFQKTLDQEQARIWKIDTEKFYEQEKEINEKVRAMNILNSEYLKNQIENRRGMKNSKMTEHEWALNSQLLHQIKVSPSVSVAGEEKKD